MNEQKKMTALVASVGADAKQSFNIRTENSITENIEKFNPLKTLSMEKLYETVY